MVNLHRLVDEPGSTIIIRSGCNERRRDLIGRDDRPELERRRKEPIGLHRSEILMRIGILKKEQQTAEGKDSVV